MSLPVVSAPATKPMKGVTAARLASIAAKGEVVVSRETMEAAHLDSGITDWTTVELKGLTNPVEVHIVR